MLKLGMLMEFVFPLFPGVIPAQEHRSAVWEWCGRREHPPGVFPRAVWVLVAVRWLLSPPWLELLSVLAVG